MKKILLTLILIGVIVTVCLKTCSGNGDEKSAAPSAAQPKKEAQIDKALQHKIDSFISHQPWVGTLGLMVYDATLQKTVYAFHEDSLMRPASCMKLLTCIAALRTYGKSAVHHNRLYCTGRMVGDTLVGDVTVKLQFDPFFTSDSLYKLTAPLGKSMHIRHIKGRVVLDMADYTLMQHEIHWTIGDLKARALGLPFLGGKRLKNEMIFAMSRLGITVKRDSIVYGRLAYHRHAPKDGKGNTKSPYMNCKLVCDITTPYHFSLLKSMKNSSNTNAEALLYPLGYAVSDKGNYRYNGTVRMKWFVSHELHMDPKKVCVIHDGCGLCPDDRVTPRLLVNLLNYALHNKYIYNEVMEDLPLSGNDGTLHDRLRKPSVLSKVKAKTGTLTREAGISTLSGYYKAKNGHLMIFSIMNNECPVMDGRWWQDRFLTRIVDGIELDSKSSTSR